MSCRVDPFGAAVCDPVGEACKRDAMDADILARHTAAIDDDRLPLRRHNQDTVPLPHVQKRHPPAIPIRSYTW